MIQKDKLNRVELKKDQDSSIPKNHGKISQLLKNKQFVYILVIFLLIITTIFVSTLLWTNDDSDGDNNDEQSGLARTTALVNGKAEISEDGQNWKAVTKNTAIKIGDSIRTFEDGRAIITFEDESVVRLDYSSSLQIVNISDTEISLNQTQGDIYSRIATSNKKYNIMMGSAIFTAHGTAFKTLRETSKKSLEVYEGSVEVDINNNTQIVKSGYGLYSDSNDNTSSFVLKKLSPSEVQNSQFVLWNLTRDQHNPNFKDYLGFLAKLDSNFQTAPNTTKQISKEASMKLFSNEANNKLQLSWKSSGFAKDTWFALTFSRTTKSPNSTHDLNREQEVNSIRVGGNSNFTWDYPDGKTVWIRLCAYNLDGAFGGGDVLLCIKTCNLVTYKAPYNANKIVQSGDVELTADDRLLSWSHKGTAPFGYLVVGPSEYDGTWDTALTNRDMSDTSLTWFYVCKKGYYELVDCSNSVFIKKPQTP